MDEPIIYNKSNPYVASIKERYCLSHPESSKKTWHVVLDIKNSGLTYSVGDSIAIYPCNDPELVERTLEVLRASGDEIAKDKRSGQNIPLREFLFRHANITTISRKFIGEIAQRQTNPLKKEHLETLLLESHKEPLKEYLAHHEIWDALKENEEAEFTLEEAVSLMMPLLPRFYSIASSPLTASDEIHLTVANLSYITNQCIRRGVCTYYLCELSPLHAPTIPIYVQPHHGFTLPPDPAADLIMIGPGTGVAPYRGFMQERIATRAPGKNWLFFGEKKHVYDFLYKDFWHSLVDQDKLKLDCAFSRDQHHKIYVWHRMQERAAEIFEWLENGAYLFVCGDAHRMAKDVDATLHKIVREEGRMDESSAKAYIKKLKADHRYLRDVY